MKRGRSKSFSDDLVCFVLVLCDKVCREDEGIICAHALQSAIKDLLAQRVDRQSTKKPEAAPRAAAPEWWL